MSTVTLAALRQYTLNNAENNAQPLAEFVCAYFDSADPDELQLRGPAKLMAMACAHWRLLDTPADAFDARIRVFNPTLAEDGFSSEHTVIQIVHKDMPFLVDSVTMAINRSGRIAHWIVHPLLTIERDAHGDLCRTVAANARVHDQAHTQSFILLECDRIVRAQERDAVAAEISRVLGDVAAAVTDWPAMLARLQSVCNESERRPSPSSGQHEGVAFLRWLQEQHFTFLGARDYTLSRSGDEVRLEAVAHSGLGILRGEAQTPVSLLPKDALEFVESDQLVLATKAMTRATVHRPAWLDYLAVKRFDESGQVVGETRFLGLYTSKAYAAPVSEIPQVRRRAVAVMAAADVVPDSHAAKSLQAILDAYPRDELM